MIIVGYQGIGKSTLVKNLYAPDCIDLESGNFWVNGKRDDEWYKPYCHIAIHLSQQGYVVFISSHEVVRNYLKEISSEPVVVVYPSIELKDEWIKKLEDRYTQTNLEKDYKALMNAKDRYTENIMDLMHSGLYTVAITDIKYSLRDIVESLLEEYSRTLKSNNILWLNKFIPDVNTFADNYYKESNYQE